MSMRKLMITGLVAVVAFVGIAATGQKVAEARTKHGLKALGFKVYWTLLTAEQKEQAKEIIADHLADTQADRLRAAARLIEYRADVADVLTKEQREQLARLKKVIRRLPENKRKALLVRFLNRTDRALLATRVESLDGATPEQRVETGLLILDQVHDALKAALVERVSLTEEQARKIDALYSDTKDDLKPIAVRLATQRAAVIEKGIGILTEEQRAKLTKVKETVTEKVLAFIRG